MRSPFALAIHAARQARQPVPDILGGAPIASPWATSSLAPFEPDPVTAAWLSGTSVDRSVAMSVAAVAKGRHLIATTIGRFPIVGMRGAAPLAAADQPPFLRQPEAGRSRFVTILWTVDALVFYGRAFWRITERYADTGRPARFEWVPEWSAETDVTGNLVSAFGEPVGPNDSIRIDGPHEGILNFASERIREAVAIDAAASKASDNPVPSIELHQTGGDPLTDEQIAGMVGAWQRARRVSGVGYTNQSVELIPHGQAPEQLLIDGRNAVALNIARAMGIPAWAIDANTQGSSLTYSNIPDRSRELIDYGLTPYMAAIEGRLSLDDVLPAGQWCRFDTTDMLRGDFKARMDGYAIAIEAGVYTAEECRRMETGTALEESTIGAPL
jgi:hypothetical protein